MEFCRLTKKYERLFADRCEFERFASGSSGLSLCVGRAGHENNVGFVRDQPLVSMRCVGHLNHIVFSGWLVLVQFDVARHLWHFAHLLVLRHMVAVMPAPNSTQSRITMPACFLKWLNRHTGSAVRNTIRQGTATSGHPENAMINLP